MAANINDLKQMSISITEEEVNTILNALGKLPYEKVAKIINKVYSQVIIQMESKELESKNNG